MLSHCEACAATKEQGNGGHTQPGAEKHILPKAFICSVQSNLALMPEGISWSSSLTSVCHKPESFVQLRHLQPEACTWQQLCPEKHLNSGWQLITPLAACSNRLSSKITRKTLFPYLKSDCRLQILLPVQFFSPRLKSALELVFSPCKCTYTLIKSTVHRPCDKLNRLRTSALTEAPSPVLR